MKKVHNAQSWNLTFSRDAVIKALMKEARKKDDTIPEEGRIETAGLMSEVQITLHDEEPEDL